MNDCLRRLTRIEDGCADPLKYDFRNFVDFCFREVLHYDDPAWLVFDVADWMQTLSISEDGKSRGQVQCQRGAGKSIIVAIFIAWLFYCNPDIKVAVVTSTQDFANRMVKFVRSLFDGHPLLSPLAPRLADQNALSDYRKDMLDSEDRFECGARAQRDPDPSCRAYGIHTSFTGIHPDVVVADDVEIPENSGTVGKREKLHEKCREFESLMTNPHGCILIMGTPQSLDSLYLKYLDKRYVLRRWPARYPDLRDAVRCRDVSPMLLGRLERGEARTGDPTYPERFDDKDLTVKEAIEGPIMFALQFLLDPSMADEDKYPLKLRDWIVMDCAADMAPSRVVWGTTSPIGRSIDHGGLQGDCLHGPVFYEKDWVAYVRSLMYVDPSGRGKDEVAWCVAKATQGMVFVHAVGALRGDGTSDAVLDKLARVAWENGVKEVVVESNFGDGMYAKLLASALARYCQAQVTEHRASGQKEKRIIDVLGPLARMHRMVVDPRVARCEALTHQYTHVTYDRGCLPQDDLLDALAGACAQFPDLVQSDPAQVAEGRKRRSAEQAAKDHQRAWLKQQRMGRSISAGAGMPLDMQRLLREDQPARGYAARGTRGWRRT